MLDKLVYIILLNYNNYEDTIECIDSLEKINYNNYKIVIVDNKSTNDSEEILKEKYSNQYIYIQTNKNLGYAGGNNVGVKYALENNAEYLCILNNDTIVSKEFLSELVGFMECNTKCGIVGPAILESYDNSIIQSTGAKINLSKGEVPIINSGKKLKDIEENIIECDYIGGACMLVRREVIEKVGLIPENYFLFYEETEWCYKTKKLGYDIKCFLGARIIHKGSISIKSISGLSEYLMERNRVVFVKRNASFHQLIKFYIHLFSRMVNRIIFKREEKRFIKYYLHGLFNIIDKKYPFILINNKNN